MPAESTKYIVELKDFRILVPRTEFFATVLHYLGKSWVRRFESEEGKNDLLISMPAIDVAMYSRTMYESGRYAESVDAAALQTRLLERVIV